jgi:dTMP kinase
MGVPGRFITFEGVDGAGKSTHVAFVADALRARGHELVVTREPGGTAVGEALRAIVLAEPMTHETETLLMFAARREHVERVIRPALDRGAWVLCDRYTDATRAYQGGGHGVDAAWIDELARRVHGGCEPDLTILFDVPPAVSRERLARASGKGRELDKFEREDLDFAARVRDRYRELARAEPARFRVVDSSRPVADVRAALLACLPST